MEIVRFPDRSQGLDQFEIVTGLMLSPVLEISRNFLREKYPPAVPVESDPLRDPGEEGYEGGIPGVGKDQAEIEIFPSESPDKLQSIQQAPHSFTDGKTDHRVQSGIRGEQPIDRLLHQQGDPAFREESAQCMQGRKGYDCVADPVHAADQNLSWFLLHVRDEFLVSPPSNSLNG